MEVTAVVEEEASQVLAMTPRYKVIRDPVAEINMVMQLAAETIQDAYKRHKACKPAKILRRVSSFENIAVTMAADTIKSKLKRWVHCSAV
jgi:hypothetical protein